MSDANPCERVLINACLALSVFFCFVVVFFFSEKTKLVTSSAMQLNAYLYQKHFVFPELTALAVVCLFRQEGIVVTISNREKEKTLRSAPQNNRS